MKRFTEYRQALALTTLCLLTLAWPSLSCVPGDSATPGAPSVAGRVPWRGIINGTPALGSSFDAVVQLYYQGYGICTGTLITDTVVLTAAHCVYVKDCEWNELTGQSENCQLETDPATFGVYVHQSERSLDYQWRAVTDIHAHPDYDDVILVNDLALLRIDRPFEGVTPIPALPGESGLALSRDDEGKEVTYVGFGRTETDTFGDRLKLTQTLSTICLGESEKCGVANPNTVCSNYQDGSICSGDSGGPMLIERDGVLYNGAVSSYGPLDCRHYGCSTAVSAYADWIADYLGGAERPGGAECINNGQCQSGVCTLGVCCDRACTNAPCEACSTTRGASPGGTCRYTSVSCEDGDLCTLGDYCHRGACTSGWDKTCAPGDACNEAERCDPETGACLAREPKPLGTTCDDRDACTLNDYCLMGNCVGEGTVYCPPAGECQRAVGGGCDMSTGECMYAALPDGTPCGDDGNGAVCRNGACEKPSSGGGCGAAGATAGAPWAALLCLMAALPGRRRARK